MVKLFTAALLAALLTLGFTASAQAADVAEPLTTTASDPYQLLDTSLVNPLPAGDSVEPEPLMKDTYHGEVAVRGGPSNYYAPIVSYARAELRRGVRERGGDNVPRFSNGRVAPYSIGDQWCVAFATAMWSKAGFRSYQSAPYVWRSQGGYRVAVSTDGMVSWARRNKKLSRTAKPGYMIVYTYGHVGLVASTNSRGQADVTIEGNKGNAVRRLKPDLSKVYAYIQP